MSHVIELTANYRLITDACASLIIESDQRPGVILSALHERYLQEPTCYDFTGHDQQQLDVVAGESITIIARCQGRIVGCLVNEVDTCDTSRVLLHPKGGFNLIVYQNRQEDLAQFPLLSAPGSAETKAPEASVQIAPATAVLADLLTATYAYYANLSLSTPQVLRLLVPALNQAIRDNDQEGSREMLVYLCSALEALEIHQASMIKPLYDVAVPLQL